MTKFYTLILLTSICFVFAPRNLFGQKTKKEQARQKFLEKEYAIHIEPDAEIIKITPTQLVQKDATGKITSKSYYFDTKKLKRKLVYYENEKGEKHGKYFSYDTAGELTSEGSYLNGKADGEWKTYLEGKLVSVGKYLNGKATSDWKYYTDDILTSEGSYLNGNYTDTWKNYKKSGELEYSTTYEIIGKDSIQFRKTSSSGELLASGLMVDQRVEYSYQNSKEIKPVDTSTVYLFVDNNPVFPGGDTALVNFMGKNIKYPREAQEMGVEGRQFIQLVIERDGRPSNINCVQCDGICIAEELTRVVQAMPAWKPGMHKGERVRTKYTLPVMLSLE